MDMKTIDLWLPTWITLAPLLGIGLLLLIPKQQVIVHRVIGVLATLPSLGLAIYMYTQFDAGSTGWQWLKSVYWFHIPIGAEQSWSFYYHMGVDGLSMPLVLLTCIISTLAAIASMYIQEKVKGYYLLLLLLEINMLGVFLTTNLLLFFIFFELTLVIAYFLIGIWGYIKKERAANYFLIYNGIGSGFLLFAIIGLLVTCHTLEFPLIQEQIALHEAESSRLLWMIFIALLLAFAVKLPIFPFHTWMLKVHVEANPAIVMIHSGVLLKMGAYGLLRFGIGWFPDYMEVAAFVFAVMGLINLFYGAVLALVQKELKRVLAYSSISHMGILLLGIASLHVIGLQGALFQAISHGFISALLFFLVATLYDRAKTTELSELAGLARSMPVFSGIFLLAGFALLGLPGLSGFISEFFALLGLFQARPILAAISTIGFVLAACYTLRAVLKVTFGKTKQRLVDVSDLRYIELVPMMILVLLIVSIGIYPAWLSIPMETTLQTIVMKIGG